MPSVSPANTDRTLANISLLSSSNLQIIGIWLEIFIDSIIKYFINFIANLNLSDSFWNSKIWREKKKQIEIRSVDSTKYREYNFGKKNHFLKNKN